MKAFFERYQMPIIFAGLGLLLAILFITIGFLKTLLLIIFTALGGYLGFYLNEIGFFDQFKNPH